FETFKKFKVVVEKETWSSHQNSPLRSRGEFTSNEFKDYLQTHGIRRQMPPPHTPQQNGVVERRNRTIMEM
ncbi:hypothetical protein KI387_005096, partial [Taxus chinensis]